jgi:hypothetical protein
MPSTTEISACLEASRATALAAHSAASLSASAGFREAARLLRSSEALARAATAALSSLALKTTPMRSGARMPAGQAAAASVDASAAPAAAAGRRKKKDKKKVDTSNSELMNVDGGSAAVVGNSAAPSLPAFTSTLSPCAPDFVPGALAQRKLEKKASRERSPRLGASSPTPSSLPSSPPTASTSALVLMRAVSPWDRPPCLSSWSFDLSSRAAQ